MDREIQVRALSSSTRRDILKLLSAPAVHFGDQWSADPVEFGVCMTLIAEALGIAQPTTSRHLDILRQATFISIRRHQKWAYCKRDESAIRDYLAWLGDQLAADQSL